MKKKKHTTSRKRKFFEKLMDNFPIIFDLTVSRASSLNHYRNSSNPRGPVFLTF